MSRRRWQKIGLAIAGTCLVSLFLVSRLEFDQAAQRVVPVSARSDGAPDIETSLITRQATSLSSSSSPTQSPLDALLGTLLAGNATLRADRHVVGRLRSLVQRLEVQQLQQGDPAADGGPVEPIRERGWGRSDGPALHWDGITRVQSYSVTDEVVDTLRRAVRRATRQRRARDRKTRGAEAADEEQSRIEPLRVHSVADTAWKSFQNGIRQHWLYSDSNSSLIDTLLTDLASKPLRQIDEMPDKGTQLKLIITLSGGTKLLFKPMRISKDVESNPNHFVFNEMERHHAEIAAFHLDRVFGFHRVPPVAGRYINLTSELMPLAPKALKKTFYVSPVGNRCFYGTCKYYCDSHHSVCGNPDVIEGASAAFLPSEDVYTRKTWPNPWAQVYSKKGKLPAWKIYANYCDEVRQTPPFDTGRRLVDLTDIAVFDFLTGNLDRHHYYTFTHFGNYTFPIITDNGRGFGRPHRDDIELLAPVYQCCLIRASTLDSVLQFLTGRPLSAAMRQSLSNDVISDVLNERHLAALDRRIQILSLVVYDCLSRTDHSQSVVIDDGLSDH